MGVTLNNLNEISYVYMRQSEWLGSVSVDDMYSELEETHCVTMSQMHVKPQLLKTKMYKEATWFEVRCDRILH